MKPLLTITEKLQALARLCPCGRNEAISGKVLEIASPAGRSDTRVLVGDTHSKSDLDLLWDSGYR